MADSTVVGKPKGVVTALPTLDEPKVKASGVDAKPVDAKAKVVPPADRDRVVKAETPTVVADTAAANRTPVLDPSARPVSATTPTVPQRAALEASIAADEAKLRDPRNALPELRPGMGLVRVNGPGNQSLESVIDRVDGDQIMLRDVSRRLDANGRQRTEPFPISRDDLAKMVLARDPANPESRVEIRAEGNITSARVPSVAEEVSAHRDAQRNVLAMMNLERDIGPRNTQVFGALVERRAELVSLRQTLNTELSEYLKNRGPSISRSVDEFIHGAPSPTEIPQDAENRQRILRNDAAIGEIDRALQQVRTGQRIDFTPTADGRVAALAAFQQGTGNAPSLRQELDVTVGQIRGDLDRARTLDGRLVDSSVASARINYQNVVQSYNNVPSTEGDSINRTRDGQLSLTAAVNGAIMHGTFGDGRLVTSSAELQALMPKIRDNWTAVLVNQGPSIMGPNGVRFDERAQTMMNTELDRLRRIEGQPSHTDLAGTVRAANALVPQMRALEPGLGERTKRFLRDTVDSPATWGMVALAVATDGIGTALIGTDAAATAAVATRLTVGAERLGLSVSQSAINGVSRAAVFGAKVSADGVAFQTGMNLFNGLTGNPNAVGYSFGDYARSIAMLGVGKLAAGAHLARAQQLSPGLSRQFGEQLRWLGEESVGMGLVTGVDSALHSRNPQDAMRELELNTQMMLAMRLGFGAAGGIRRAYNGRPTPAPADDPPAQRVTDATNLVEGMIRTNVDPTTQQYRDAMTNLGRAYQGALEAYGPDARTQDRGTPAADRRATPSRTTPEARTEPLPRTTPEARTEPLPRTTPEARREPLPRTTPEARTEPLPRTTPEARTEPLPRTTPEARTEPLPRATPGADPSPIPRATPENRPLPRLQQQDDQPRLMQQPMQQQQARAGLSREQAANVSSINGNPAFSEPTLRAQRTEITRGLETVRGAEVEPVGNIVLALDEVGPHRPDIARVVGDRFREVLKLPPGSPERLASLTDLDTRSARIATEQAEANGALRQSLPNEEIARRTAALLDSRRNMTVDQTIAAFDPAPNFTAALPANQTPAQVEARRALFTPEQRAQLDTAFDTMAHPDGFDPNRNWQSAGDKWLRSVTAEGNIEAGAGLMFEDARTARSADEHFRVAAQTTFTPNPNTRAIQSFEPPSTVPGVVPPYKIDVVYPNGMQPGRPTFIWYSEAAIAPFDAQGRPQGVVQQMMDGGRLRDVNVVLVRTPHQGEQPNAGRFNARLDNLLSSQATVAALTRDIEAQARRISPDQPVIEGGYSAGAAWAANGLRLTTPDRLVLGAGPPQGYGGLIDPANNGGRYTWMDNILDPNAVNNLPHVVSELSLPPEILERYRSRMHGVIPEREDFVPPGAFRFFGNNVTQVPGAHASSAVTRITEMPVAMINRNLPSWLRNPMFENGTIPWPANGTVVETGRAMDQAVLDAIEQSRARNRR